jgi:nucleoside-diphosphate-sugar epimerase
MSPISGRTALITGVNGISGHAIVEHLIRQPRSEWAKIVVTSRKALPFPWVDDRVEFFPLDLLWPQEKIIAAMEPYCTNVTHAFFTSYVHTDIFPDLPKYNIPLWKNFLMAVETVAGKSLQRVCLQTGGKHYGAHLGPLQPVPYEEDGPRYDDRGENFYYVQEDFMFARQREAASRGHHWHYSIIRLGGFIATCIAQKADHCRPNGIIGYTPAANGMSESITMALYFLISRELGQVAKFPGNQFFYNCVDDCSSAKGIADISVWAMTQEHTKNEAFNTVNGDTYIWKYHWPRLAAYFGAEVRIPIYFYENVGTDLALGGWSCPG